MPHTALGPSCRYLVCRRLSFRRCPMRRWPFSLMPHAPLVFLADVSYAAGPLPADVSCAARPLLADVLDALGGFSTNGAFFAIVRQKNDRLRIPAPSGRAKLWPLTKGVFFDLVFYSNLLLRKAAVGRRMPARPHKRRLFRHGLAGYPPFVDFGAAGDSDHCPQTCATWRFAGTSCVAGPLFAGALGKSPQTASFSPSPGRKTTV